MSENTNPLTQSALPLTQQVNLQSLKDRLAQYVEAMKPGKPVNIEDGAANQTGLWNTIKYAINRDGGEFVLLYSELLRFVQEHRQGAFNERYIYRFFDTLRMSSQERRNFERILNLLLCTCDPRTRQLALRQIDMRTTLGGLTDSNLQQRIMGFYQS